ncbi:hypothetical protein BDY17DRAFT_300820 [Neohortaea acidophila]|uniref:Uncharacterized protein n=1 Tax=Neohortaea acidophila TaxID=245834 RepID=A0A6A6PPJ3_9PEZI|nr:uncharacterized protein BDY17DRAFT_300820 [Neohortaea acidophila]KAF2481177.1 hypothetical protein BDY17DRAFT_300820 [Neohortaea acidophila]
MENFDLTSFREATMAPFAADDVTQRPSTAHVVTPQDENGNTTTRPQTSSAASSRHAKRLQLRNAGFRAAPVPTRKVTPRSSHPSSSLSGMRSSPDIENISPKATPAPRVVSNRRRSSGVLQEIGNSSSVTHRPKRVRKRLSKAFDLVEGFHDPPSPPPRQSPSPPPTRSRFPRLSWKSKPAVSHRRRTASSEMSKYIDHLEGQLAAAESRISTINSPSVIREQRNHNVETKQLQEDLADWENKYEQRVQEEVDRHVVIETDLRARIRHLELEVEEAKFRVQELETQVDTTKQNMEAVECANVSLEKRLEMLSELLASTKVDLHAETPGRTKRHSRPKSMLPRFPTASTLHGSPERYARTSPSSPRPSYASVHSPRPSIHGFDGSPGHSDYFMSEAESIFSEDSLTADSMTSVEHSEAPAGYNPWNLPIRQNNTVKPARRMRKFGAGSLGPKPLILPATSNREPYEVHHTPPPLEHRKTAPESLLKWAKIPDESHGRSPSPARPRASTTANELTVRKLQESPFARVEEHTLLEDTLVSLTPPRSPESSGTPRILSSRVSSIDGVLGRNLMEELTAARAVETPGSEVAPSDVVELKTGLKESNGDADSPTGNSLAENKVVETDFADPSSGENSLVKVDSEASSDEVEGWDVVPPTDSSTDLIETASTTATVGATSSTATLRPGHRRSHSRNVGIPGKGGTDSTFGRLRLLFGDLWRSPVTIARYLIQTAQAKMSIPRPLLNVQWWLVGILLGPMIKSRMLAAKQRCCEDAEQRPLLQTPEPDDSPPRTPDMAHNSVHETPPDPTPPPGGAKLHTHPTGAPRSMKRVVHKVRCVHHRSKHSPWLWIKFSLTLAFAIGAAFKDGPGSLLKQTVCSCRRKEMEGLAASQNRKAITL